MAKAPANAAAATPMTVIQRQWRRADVTFGAVVRPGAA
jgi:hypothetical protein